MRNLAQSIPAKYRTAIYSILGTLVGLEAIFDVVPDVWEGKILAALVVLGFGVAVGNVSKVDEYGDPL
jgi:ABC-type phosphate transport system permease subunit